MTHGSHWECIVEDVEDFFENNFEKIVQDSIIIEEMEVHGHNIATEKKQNNTIHTLLYPLKESVPYSMLTQIVNKQLWTSYPVVNFGMEHEIIITAIRDEGNFVEARISCKLKDHPDFTFTFFDTMFYKNKSHYSVGETYAFYFSGMMYGGGANQFVDTKVPGIDDISDIFIDKDTVAFVANEDADIDDYKIMSPLLSIEEFTHDFGKKIYKINILLLKDDVDFSIPVLLAEQNIKDGFVPKVGESINGSLWLCGTMVP